MTKYILNSGGSKNYPERAKKFFAEVINSLGKKPRLLVCFFAQPREDWEKKLVEDRNTLLKLFPKGVEPVLEMAFPATLEKQIQNSDVINIRGGDDHLLQYWLRRFDLPKIWDGKVVAATSAGSHALSKHFWTCDWREAMDGLGVLPIKFLAHYRSLYGNDDPRGPIDWGKAHRELEIYGDKSLPIYALEEGEYVVFEQ